ncbi:nucleoid-associated protein [Acinetobacter baumannii]|uniref:nucleoid-associated protein n=1 Tax=Acinetobacter baumannii TaxID=470 RepID=UPI00111F27DB|nr:nucleoid-associated protein [Acinetobacter baumannii]
MTSNSSNAEYIVHKLEKEVNTTGETTLTLRNSPLAVNDSAQRLIDAIHEKYSKLTGKSFGTFESNLDNYPTQKYLKEYLGDIVTVAKDWA